MAFNADRVNSKLQKSCCLLLCYFSKQITILIEHPILHILISQKHSNDISRRVMSALTCQRKLGVQNSYTAATWCSHQYIHTLFTISLSHTQSNVKKTKVDFSIALFLQTKHCYYNNISSSELQKQSNSCGGSQRTRTFTCTPAVPHVSK